MAVEIDEFLEIYAPPVVPTLPQALQQLSTLPIAMRRANKSLQRLLKQMSNAQMETVVPASEKMETPPAKKRPNSEAELRKQFLRS